jgi:glycogen(starch) synthase
MTDILAREFTAAGHDVTVVTRTATSAAADYPFKVCRRPSNRELFRLVGECDVFVHNHLSLKVAWPLLFFRRPWLVIYQTWYPKAGVRGWLRPLFSRFALNIACSNALARYIGRECCVIPNSYDHSTFRKLPGLTRDRELVFVGRLIADKGVHVLLEALALLRAEGLRPRLSVVGLGPDADSLKAKVADLKLKDQVEFIGPRSGDALADILNSHEILVAPSVWREPFGIVALEAIACGCIVVGSESGGLKEAIGPCGVTFRNGDAPALANALSRLSRSRETWPRYRDGAEHHLRRHTPAAVAIAYLEAIEELRVRGPAAAGSLMLPAGKQRITDDPSSRELPMKILLWSYSFRPNIGGIETMAEILAREFTALGHQVTVVTRTTTASGELESFPFFVIRAPSGLQLLRAVRGCDVFLHNHLSLKAALPLLLYRRPWVVVYHCLYPTSGLHTLLQRFSSRFSVNIACSKALADRIRVPCRVMSNAYDDAVFRNVETTRDRELIFVGRLLSDKGVHVLLAALVLLRGDGIRPRLTVVGTGQDSDFLAVKCKDLGLSDQVEFVGKKGGPAVAALLNSHQILVVPSLVWESFGIVALEAIACGCTVVATEGSGLAEAIGPCGVTVPPGDAPALARALSRLLLSPVRWPQYHQCAADHLRPHSAAAVASAYLNVLKQATERRGRGQGFLRAAFRM